MTDSVSDSEYTSVKFGVNKFQKKNKELENENNVYKELNSKLKQEIDSVKELYNTSVLSSHSINSTNDTEIVSWTEKYNNKNVELESKVKEYKETLSKLEILEETNKSLSIDLNICKEKLEKTLIESTEMLNKYNDIKQRNIELKELCNIKSTMNMNTDITIAELSSQINIKNEYLEKAKTEVNEAKRVMIEYRESNKILRSKLDDKDAYIVKLNGELSDMVQTSSRLDNTAIPNVHVNESSGSSTPRVTTYKENTQLQVQETSTVRRAVKRESRV